MSLINKMLQDLDARGSRGTEGAAGGAGVDTVPSDVRPVSRPERRVPLPVVLVGALGAVSLAAGGYFALRFYQQRQAPAPQVAQVAARAPAAVVTEAVKPAAAPEPIQQPIQRPIQQQIQQQIQQPGPEPAPGQKQAEQASAPYVAPVAVPKSQPRAVPRSAGKAAAGKPPARTARATDARSPAPASAPNKAAADVRGSASAAYRRALDMLADGRVSDAIATLEQAVRQDPRHDGARQTLVGLLIEKGRHEEAMRHLQAALALDAGQPSMAMLLARLQIERGGNGIDTLMRTLPAAAGRPEYHAFLAGALARVQRHREAAEQYSAALRGSPDNAVWLMGLGIALQGDGREAEALAAYQRARAAGTLSAELQSFVERKIGQLSR
jgi:MSHA biogenesis protein MshN